MRSLLLGACSAAALYAGIAHAQVAEVLVTGYLEEEIPQELAQYGVRVETVTAEEILNGGYVDVGTTLQSQIPGLYLAPLSGAFDYHQSSYQGSGTNELLWLVDGVRINNRLYSTTPPIDTMPSHMVERIELLEGGQALFYGTQAVSGAINIVTKDFSENPEGRISVGAGSRGERHINGFFRDGFGAHQIVVYGSSDQATGFQPFPDADYQPSATDRRRGYDVVTLGGKYGVEVGENARVSVSYQHTDAKLDWLRPKDIAIAFNEREEDILSGKFDWAVSDQFEFFFKGYYHWWNSYFTEFDNDTSNPGTLISIDDRAFWGFKDYGLNGVAKYAPGGGVEFYGGYDFQNYSGRDDVFLIGPQTESVHAPFAQIRTTEALIPNVKLSAGIRHNMPSDAQSATVWNVTGRWDITPNFFARGNLGTAFRLPDAYELYVIDPCCEQGNPNLKPENSLNFNGSIGGRLPLGMGTLTFEAVGFYREVINKIEIVFDPNLNIDTFANSGPTVDVLGGELILGVDLDDVFSANLSYSFNSTEAKGTNVQLADVPESLLKASFDYHPMRLPVGASLSVNHVGDVYRNAAGVQEYGNYTTVDVGARVYLGADRRHRIGVNALNLFNKEYVTRVRTTTPDGGGAAYPYHFLGTPQTFILDYSYEFSLM